MSLDNTKETKLSMTWSFLESDPNRTESNPILEEFFSASEILTDVSALVRESIQNSLDAEKLSPVMVTFRIGQIKSKNVNEFFLGLEKHVQSALTPSHNTFNSADCRYLVVEDFHTTGLLGEVTTNGTDAKAKPEKNGYWYFAKANADSGKGNGTRGTWGVGKIVFPKMSSIKTFFAYSVREEKGKFDPILFGQSLLKFHDVEARRFEPYGWWGRTTNVNGKDRDIPLGSDAILNFTDAWEISRKSNQEGLSIVIPWVDSDLEIDEIFSCVLKDYFVAILQGILECEFKDFNGVDLRIDKESVIEHIRLRVDRDSSWATLFDLAQIYKEWNDGRIEPFELDLRPSNRWQDLALDEETTSKMILCHESDVALAVRVTCVVPGTTGGISSGVDTFLVLLAKRDVREKAIFSRSGILIPKANPIRIYGSVALVIVEKPKPAGHYLATMLSAAEGPAHENWSKDGDRFNDIYKPKKLAADSLSMVRQAPSEIAKIVSAIAEGRNTEALADSFPIPDGTRFNDVRKPDKGDDPKIEVPPIPPPNPKYLTINKTNGGFSITGSSEELVGKFAHVRVAYQMRRGNSQKRYISSDFDLKNLVKSCKGVSAAAKDNLLQLSDFESGFRISFEGFDPMRDLEILATISEKSEVF